MSLIDKLLIKLYNKLHKIMAAIEFPEDATIGQEEVRGDKTFIYRGNGIWDIKTAGGGGSTPSDVTWANIEGKPATLVETLTGDGVSGTSKDKVMSFPNASEVGAEPVVQGTKTNGRVATVVAGVPTWSALPSSGDVYKAGNNAFTGPNSFTTPPTIAANATLEAHAVRLAQLNTVDSKVTSLIPVTLESNTVPFDKSYFIGNTTRRTGNILFNFTGAVLGMNSRMIHNASSPPSFPAQAKILSGEYEINVDNYIWMCITKLNSGAQIVEVTISQ